MLNPKPVIAYLIIKDHPSLKDKLPLYQGQNIIGRVPEKSNVIIKDGQISSAHAKIKITPQKILISDVGSKNGTFVNLDIKQRLQKGVSTQIKEGQPFAFGQMQLFIQRIQQNRKSTVSPQKNKKAQQNRSRVLFQLQESSQTFLRNKNQKNSNEPKQISQNIFGPKYPKKDEPKINRIKKESVNLRTQQSDLSQSEQSLEIPQKNQQLKNQKQTKNKFAKEKQEKQKQLREKKLQQEKELKQKQKISKKQKQKQQKQKQQEQKLQKKKEKQEKKRLIEEQQREDKQREQRQQRQKAQLETRKKEESKKIKQKNKKKNQQLQQNDEGKNKKDKKSKANSKEKDQKGQKSKDQKRKDKQKSVELENKKTKNQSKQKEKEKEASKKLNKQTNVDHKEQKKNSKQKKMMKKQTNRVLEIQRDSQQQNEQERRKSNSRETKKKEGAIKTRKILPRPYRDKDQTSQDKQKVYRTRQRFLKITKFMVSGPPITFHTNPMFKLVTDIDEDFDVLVMQKFIRTFKLLFCIVRGIPIVSKLWLVDSEIARKTMQFDDYWLKHPENKNLIKESVQKSKEGFRVLNDMKFFIACDDDKLHIPYENLQRLIYAAGGQVLRSLKSVKSNKNLCKQIIILMNEDYSDEELSTGKEINKDNIYQVQLVLQACLTQELELKKYKVKA